MFSDQDVLNMLFDGKVDALDFCWNYTTFVAGHLQSGNIHSQTLYADLQRDKPAIIHYVGKRKPWSTGEILREQYEKYYNIMENKI
ncbi:MAG: glycosyltransferase [Eubacterium sp.]